jgi:hypothetical protein
VNRKLHKDFELFLGSAVVGVLGEEKVDSYTK